MELTLSQRYADIDVTKWWKSGDRYIRPYRLGGAAGTGKTFFIYYIIEKLKIPWHKVLIMAYTGQAVSVLRRRGMRAFTIHSQIKELEFVDKVDDKGNIIHRNGIPYKEPRWTTVDEIVGEYELILVDEASFVNKKLAVDIESFGIPVMYVGDHEQLDPVMGESSFTRETLDFELLDQMRQAKDSSLLRYLTDVRLGNPIKPSSYRDGVFFISGKNKMPATVRRYRKLIQDVDIILAASNKQRQLFTNAYREEYFKTDNPIPVAGERMICRRNRWNYKLGDYPLVNGTLGHVLYNIPMCDIDYKNRIFHMDFQPTYIKHDYFDNMVCDLDFLTQPFGDKDVPHYRNYNLMEYGSAISVHLSQGAQFKNVIYLPSTYKGDDEYRRKIDYTAGSRTEENLFILVNSN